MVGGAVTPFGVGPPPLLPCGPDVREASRSHSSSEDGALSFAPLAVSGTPALAQSHRDKRGKCRDSARAVTPGQPLGFPWGSWRVVVIPVVMAAPTTANKSNGARLRVGSARGMACRQSRSAV